jgi:hypothetical protein
MYIACLEVQNTLFEEMSKVGRVITMSVLLWIQILHVNKRRNEKSGDDRNISLRVVTGCRMSEHKHDENITEQPGKTRISTVIRSYQEKLLKGIGKKFPIFDSSGCSMDINSMERGFQGLPTKISVTNRDLRPQ